MGLVDASGDASLALLQWLSALMAIFAGLAADVGGARRVSIVGAALLAAGVAALAVSAPSALYLATGLIAAGDQLFRIGIALLVADLYGQEDDRRDAGFTLLAMGAGIGGLAGPAALGVLADYEAEVGFALACAIPLVAVLAVTASSRGATPSAEPARTSWSASRAAAIVLVLVAITTLLGAATNLVPRAPLSADDEDVVLFGLQISSDAWRWLLWTAHLAPAPLLAWLWLRLGRHQPSTAAKIALGGVLTAAGALAAAAVTSPDLVDGGILHLPTGLLVRAIALGLVIRVAPPRRRGLFVGAWLAAPELSRWIGAAAEQALAGASEPVTVGLAAGAALAAAFAAYLLVRLGAGGRGSEGTAPAASLEDPDRGGAAAGQPQGRLSTQQRVMGLCLDVGVLVGLSIVFFAAGHGAGSIGLLVLAADSPVWGVAATVVAVIGLAACVSRPTIHALLVLVTLAGLVAAWWFFVSMTEMLELTLATSSPFLVALAGRLIHLALQLRARRS
jgi:proton-dependent oligopeptide transporter, POT family